MIWIGSCLQATFSLQKKTDLPPEVFVKFTRSFTQDSVLLAINDKEFKIKDNKVRILKENPWHVWQQRKEYFFITKMRMDNKSQYKCLFFKALNFLWEGKPVKLDSIAKARRFAIDNAQKFWYQPCSVESSSDNESQSVSSQQSATGGAPKSPRTLRQRTVVKNINYWPRNSIKYCLGM